MALRKEADGVDGFAAVLLWHRYLRGESSALSKLVRYNRADIAAMGALFDEAVARLDVHPDLFAPEVKFLPWSAPKGWRRLPKSLPRTPPRPYRAPHFVDLFGQGRAAHTRIVGIDLTGSEKRGTGWAVLNGSHATTLMLHTDEDILAKTLRTEPDLVSVNSPSLPSDWPFKRGGFRPRQRSFWYYAPMRKGAEEARHQRVSVPLAEHAEIDGARHKIGGCIASKGYTGHRKLPGG